MVKLSNLESLLERYNETALRGGIELGSRNGDIDSIEEDFHNKPDAWIDKVIAGLNPSFNKKDANIQIPQAIGVGKFLSEAFAAGYNPEKISHLDEIHTDSLNFSFEPMSEAISDITERYDINQEMMDEILALDNLNRYVIKFPTAESEILFIIKSDEGTVRRGVFEALTNNNINERADKLISFRESINSQGLANEWDIDLDYALDLMSVMRKDVRTNQYLIKPPFSPGFYIPLSKISEFREAANDVTIDYLVEQTLEIKKSKLIEQYSSGITDTDKVFKFLESSNDDPKISKYGDFIQPWDINDFRTDVQRILYETVIKDQVELDLLKAWGIFRGNLQPNFIVEEQHEEKPFEIPLEQLKFQFDRNEEGQKIVNVFNRLIKMKEPYTRMGVAINKYLQDKIEEQNNFIAPYLNEMREIAKSRIEWLYSTQNNEYYNLLRGEFHWPNDSSENEDMTTSIPLNSEQLNTLNLSHLNPVELTALVLYTSPSILSVEGIDKGEHLKDIGKVLDLYKTISTLSDTPFPQGDNPWIFYQKSFPDMILEYGLIPLETGLQQLADELSLDEKLNLSNKEIAKIVINLKQSKTKTDNDFSGNISSILMNEGSQLYMNVGDEQQKEQIKDTIWRSIPRFIEANGYESLDDIIKTRFKKSKKDEIYAAVEREKGNLRYTEKFDDTTKGSLVYVASNNVPDLVNHLHNLVSTYNREHTKSIPTEKNLISANSSPATYEVPIKSELIVDEDFMEEIRKQYIGNSHVDLRKQLGETSTDNMNAELKFYRVSSFYRTSNFPPSRSRTPTKVKREFGVATDNYIKYLEANDISEFNYQNDLSEDVRKGNELIESLYKHKPKLPEAYIRGFKEKIERLKDFLPVDFEDQFNKSNRYIPEIKQPQVHSSGGLGFLKRLVGR